MFKNFISVFLIIVLIVFVGSMNISYAEDPVGSKGSESTEAAISGLEGGEGVYGTINQIMNLLFGVGLAVAVGKMMHIGIKFMTTTATKKSDAKDALLPWAIGTIALVMFWGLSTWLIRILDSGEQGKIFDI